MNQTNCIVAQSGGPTAAINASLAGVISGVLRESCYDKIYGSINGIQGIFQNKLIDLTEKCKNDPSFMDCLIHTPAMYLGSCRYKLPDVTEDETPYTEIFHLLEAYHIGAFFYIGGNDSMDTVCKLSAYGKKIGSDIRFIGVPKTIDNDLTCTDHTPGFGSAAKYIATTMLEIAHDTFIYDLKSVTIVEIMGRDAGWLTASAALARTSYQRAPHLIYLPETDFSEELFLSDVSSLLEKQNNVIVAISEGIHDKDGNYISAGKAASDAFGHSQLSGAGKALEYLVKEHLHVKVRSVEINVLQRAAAHLASKTDIEEAFMQGEHAVTLAKEGITASMVTLVRDCDQPYRVHVSHAPIAEIANEARSIPREWINEAGNDINEPLITYLCPLIEGEVSISYQNGIPQYADISHLI